MNDKVILNRRRGFGGQRIADGQVSVDLWSDGAVLGTAWTMNPASVVSGELFTFRGTLLREPFRTSKWVLRDDQRGWEGDFRTRAEALAYVDGAVSMAAFRTLNRIEAAR